jgi:hypothetical protein
MTAESAFSVYSPGALGLAIPSAVLWPVKVAENWQARSARNGGMLPLEELAHTR